MERCNSHVSKSCAQLLEFATSLQCRYSLCWPCFESLASAVPTDDEGSCAAARSA